MPVNACSFSTAATVTVAYQATKLRLAKHYIDPMFAGNTADNVYFCVSCPIMFMLAHLG